MEKIYEKKIKNYPDPVTIKETKEILEQMTKCICKIYPSIEELAFSVLFYIIIKKRTKSFNNKLSSNR